MTASTEQTKFTGHKPAQLMPKREHKQLTDKERATINRAIIESVLHRGVKSVEKAVESKQIPTEFTDKKGVKHSINQEKLKSFIGKFNKRHDEFRKKFLDIRDTVLRKQFSKPLDKAKEESKADDVKEEVKVEETKVEQADDKK